MNLKTDTKLIIFYISLVVVLMILVTYFWAAASLVMYGLVLEFLELA